MGCPFEVLNARLDAQERLLLELLANQKKVITPNQTDFVGLKEAAAILGYNEKTLYNKVYYKQIPHYKKQSKLLFSRKELDNWIREGKKENTPESCLIKKRNLKAA